MAQRQQYGFGRKLVKRQPWSPLFCSMLKTGRAKVTYDFFVRDNPTPAFRRDALATVCHCPPPTIQTRQRSLFFRRDDGSVSVRQ
jgi:hypothetical protein